MSIKKILSNAFVYGFGDVIVTAVGGFLLMPVYTRALSQSDYGVYIIVKTNTDIFTYLMHFGLISAVGRLYFDYKKKNEHYQYLSSVLLLFLCVSLIAAVATYFFGSMFWAVLSPAVQPYPYLWFCFAMGLFGFFSALSLIWLRVEEEALMFVYAQLASALILLALVLYNLVLLQKGLIGLLYALLVNSIFSAALLPLLLRKHLVLRIKIEHITESLRYAIPIVAGYCAYFVLNKGNTVILQRYVPVDQIAIFGLGQQLAMIVTMASVAFAKALQPMIFSAEREHVANLVDNSGSLYIFLMFCFSSLLILFASDILGVVAPAKYSSCYNIFIIMLLANFVLAVNFISDSVLLYFKSPSTSVSISIFGGVVALGGGLLLIPKYHLYGAAVSSLIAFSGVFLAGMFATRKLLPHSALKHMSFLFPITVLVSAFAVFLRNIDPGYAWSLFIKIIVSILLLFSTYLAYKKKTKAYL